jgi:orotidine-5'-phosphate decarboxylase
MPCDLILALDVGTRAEAIRTLEPLKGRLRWVKIGLQLFTAHSELSTMIPPHSNQPSNIRSLIQHNS